MKVLLDTHPLFWFIEGDVKLSNTAAAVIGEPRREVVATVEASVGNRKAGQVLFGVRAIGFNIAVVRVD